SGGTTTSPWTTPARRSARNWSRGSSTRSWPRSRTPAARYSAPPVTTTRSHCSRRSHWPTNTPSSSPCPHTSACPDPSAATAQKDRRSAMIDTLIPAMTEVCGADYVITDPAELRTYECDGLTSQRSIPGLVVLPEPAEQVAGVVRACAAAGVPFVARGSGTGLSGGALAPVDGVLIVT